jgi:ATP-binding cassette subfamily B (MDR/TAP) protein 1
MSYAGFIIGIIAPHLLSVLKARVAAAVLYKTIDHRPDAIDPLHRDGAVPPLEERQGKIEFSNVHFAYPSRGKRMVLAGVSWSAQPGEVVALVGESGAGKSTSVGLITRLYDCLSGSVAIDGIDVREWNLTALRQSIGIVQQEPVLFSASVWENVVAGRDSAVKSMMKKVVEACKVANAHEFIMKLEGSCCSAPVEAHFALVEARFALVGLILP